MTEAGRHEYQLRSAEHEARLCSLNASYHRQSKVALGLAVLGLVLVAAFAVGGYDPSRGLAVTLCSTLLVEEMNRRHRARVREAESFIEYLRRVQREGA